MLWVIVLGVLVFMVGGIIGSWRYFREIHPDRILAAMNAVAPKINGRVIDGPELTFSRSGHHARVSMFLGLGRVTEIWYSLAGELESWLAVSTESLGDELARQLGYTDLQIGDRDFDSTFHIQAGDVGFATKHLQGDLKMLLRDMARRHTFSFRISPKFVKIRIFRHLVESGDLESAVAWSMQVFDLLGIASAGDVMVSEVSADIGLDSVCDVCGTGLSKGSIVRCAKCATPHHQECWEYNQKQCATFACGGREAR